MSYLNQAYYKYINTQAIKGCNDSSEQIIRQQKIPQATTES